MDKTLKVILEAQWACTPVPRGVPRYTINLFMKLLERNRNYYGITFFDKLKERNNRAYIEKYFGKYKVDIFECNTINYRDLLLGQNLFESKGYDDVTSAKGEVFHFTSVYPVPETLDGQMVVTIHDVIPLIFSNLVSPEYVRRFQVGCERIKRVNPYIIADSFSAKEDIVNYLGISPNRISVVPLAYCKHSLYPDKNKEILSQIGITCPYLLYLGAIFDERKGVVDLLKSYEIIARKYDGFKLVLVGEHNPAYAPVREVLESLDLSDKIIRTGFVSEEQKRVLLSNASVFLFPSEYEGFGLPVLEAMACGSPVITTNVSSLPEVGGDAAVYVSPKNSEQLAFEIERLLNSESLRNEYIQKGFEQAKKFSWDKTAEMTEEVYKIAYERC